MTWVAVAVAGGAILSAGASYAGSKKQASASKKGADMQLQMFDTLNQQQQPYIQSGYGAMNKLNSLLGIGGGPSGGMQSGGMRQPSTYAPTPQGGMDQRVGIAQPMGTQPNVRLRHILMLRAQNGDTEAARMLGDQ